MDRFGVVQIGDVLITPDLNEDEFANRRAFVGDTPAAGAAFAITQQPIPAGECGWAIVLGVTTCTLNVTSEGDTYAGPAADDVADLATDTSGPALILWKDSGTGAGVRAKVLLLGQGAGSSDPCESIQVVTNVTFDDEDCTISLTTETIYYRDCAP